MKVTSKERKALEYVAKHGTIGWSESHANTINALKRKGLIEHDPHRWQLTGLGEKAIEVPDVFADLFPKVVPVDPDRAAAAAEVLAAVWLDEKHFELEHEIGEPPVAEQDADGHVWVTVKLHVPALDVDMWLDGTHLDHPSNQDDDDA